MIQSKVSSAQPVSLRAQDDAQASVLRNANEQAFEQLLRSYILSNTSGAREFTFGGLVNLFTTLATLCEQIELDQRCADYGVAAAEIRRLETVLDLGYAPGEVVR
jgi:hypothetical protein